MKEIELSCRAFIEIDAGASLSSWINKLKEGSRLKEIELNGHSWGPGVTIVWFGTWHLAGYPLLIDRMHLVPNDDCTRGPVWSEYLQGRLLPLFWLAGCEKGFVLPTMGTTEESRKLLQGHAEAFAEGFSTQIAGERHGETKVTGIERHHHVALLQMMYVGTEKQILMRMGTYTTRLGKNIWFRQTGASRRGGSVSISVACSCTHHHHSSWSASSIKCVCKHVLQHASVFGSICAANGTNVVCESITERQYQYSHDHPNSDNNVKLRTNRDLWVIIRGGTFL
jgi:hypothetical protein